MDISSPANVSLDQVTLELISDAKVLARQVNESRPLSQDVIKNIEKELLGERVYNSNAIEGNTLTLRETRSVLQAGSIADVSRKREVAEALNLAKAISEVEEMIQEPESWSDIHRFIAVHRTILSGVKDDAAGRICSNGIIITGAKYQPPDPAQLDVLLRTPKKTSVAALRREWSRCKEERRDDKCRRGAMTPQIGHYRRNPPGRLCLRLRLRRSSSAGCPASSSLLA